MTQPDSGEYLRARTIRNVENPMKPDSGEREVCSVCLREKVVRGDGLQEDRCWRGFFGDDDRKCYQLGYERLAALVGIEPSLAQRILAALEKYAETQPLELLLVDELRAIVERKP